MNSLRTTLSSHAHHTVYDLTSWRHQEALSSKVTKQGLIRNVGLKESLINAAVSSNSDPR
jgi:hypothetical protein